MIPLATALFIFGYILAAFNRTRCAVCALVVATVILGLGVGG